MVRRVVCASALALAAAGCGGHGGGGTRPPAKPVDLIPFDDAQPASLASRPATPAPACRAAQLRVEGDGLVFVPGAQQGGTGTAVLRNRGDRPCRLTGRPSVRFVGGSAPPPQRRRALGADELEFPKLAPSAASLLALAPGQGAVLSVDWDNWCPRASAAAKRKGLQPPKALRVTLPGGGGSLDVKYNAVVACVHPDQPSVLGVRPFAPQPLQAASGFTSAPMTVSAHPLNGGNGVLRARRGQQLRFAVELRNASKTQSVTFDRCPLVAEKLAPIGPTEAHQLNCAAGPIRPGGVRWFEMRVRVPANAPLGPNGLFWRLDPVGDFAPQTVARVIVGR
jgi:Protein of unknown function (DUF4232)